MSFTKLAAHTVLSKIAYQAGGYPPPKPIPAGTVKRPTAYNRVPAAVPSKPVVNTYNNAPTEAKPANSSPAERFLNSGDNAKRIAGHVGGAFVGNAIGDWAAKQHKDNMLKRLFSRQPKNTVK